MKRERERDKNEVFSSVSVVFPLFVFLFFYFFCQNTTVFTCFLRRERIFFLFKCVVPYIEIGVFFRSTL